MCTSEIANEAIASERSTTIAPPQISASFTLNTNNLISNSDARMSTTKAREEDSNVVSPHLCPRFIDPSMNDYLIDLGVLNDTQYCSYLASGCPGVQFHPIGGFKADN